MDATPARPQRAQIMAYIFGGILLGGLGVWGVQELWRIAGEVDAGPPPNGLQEQLMRRKSDAMHNLLDAMVDGKLRRVETAASRVEESAQGIENFLSSDIYQQHGEEFFAAVQEVQRAASQGDLEATKEATIRLERSCLDCHQQLNESVDAGQWRRR